MPRVKIDYIVSFSSEDPENPANNLLNWEVSKKRWLCTKGEPSCSVVLQLTKAILISAVHIGSHHSALVEVLVGRSEKPNDPFEVLVPSSIFLTPASSRSSEAVERVRSFSTDQLSTARTQRWDRLRVVCSQPYNKHCKYGLSFVHVYEPEGPTQQAPPQQALPQQALPQQALPQQALGRLSLAVADSQDSDSDEFRPGEMFAKHFVDTGAQIRKATSHALKNISDSATKLVKTPIAKQTNKRTDDTDSACGSRQRDQLLYTDEDRPHDKIDRIIKQNKDQKAKDATESQLSIKERNSKIKGESPKGDRIANDSKNQRRIDLNTSKTKETVTEKKSPSSKDKEQRAREKSKERPSCSNDGNGASRSEKKKRPREEEEPEMPLESVLSGVVFVLSGYQNPERAALRQLAIDMGARYEREWGPSCNMLVCAFPNTPKLRQARATGGDMRVVTADWLRRCYDLRRRLPLPGTEPAPSLQQHSDDGDTDDEIERVLKKKKRRLNSADDTMECDDAASKPVDDDTLTKSNDNTSPQPDKDDDMTMRDDSPTPDDADATIMCDEDVVAINGDGSDYDYDDETDTEEFPRRERIDPEKSLPPIFAGRAFVVATGAGGTEGGGAGADVAATLRRYIVAYGGLVLQESDIDEDTHVDFVVGASGTEHVGGVRRPAHWVWRCHREKKLLPQ